MYALNNYHDVILVTNHILNARLNIINYLDPYEFTSHNTKEEQYVKQADLKMKLLSYPIESYLQFDEHFMRWWSFIHRHAS